MTPASSTERGTGAGAASVPEASIAMPAASAPAARTAPRRRPVDSEIRIIPESSVPCPARRACLIFELSAGGNSKSSPRNPAIENVLLLFGAPPDATDPGGLVGYLLGAGETEGTDASMFTSDDTPVEIGFLSVYARLGTVAPIPLPAPVLMLLSALAAFGLLARGRRPG